MASRGNSRHKKTRSFKIFYPFWVVLICSSTGFSQDRLSVSPASITLSVRSSQMDTKFIEVTNKNNTYISVKTRCDTNWISLFPSNFILLPSGTKKVMAVFSIKNRSQSGQHDEILFTSKEGIEGKVNIEMTDSAVDYSSGQKSNQAGQQKSLAPEDVNTTGNKNSTKEPNLQSETELQGTVGTSGDQQAQPGQNVPKNGKKISINKKSQDDYPVFYQFLVDSLNAEIADLKRRLQESEQETERLIQQIKQQDKRISELLSNLSDDMIAELRELYNFSTKYFAKEIADNSIELTWSGDKFVIIVDGQVGFSSGSIELAENGRQILEKIASIANTKGKYEKIISVRGHTDSFPIKKGSQDIFPSNWELSALRAATVVRTLEKELGVKGENLSLSAFSYFRPITDNLTEAGRRKNRRIEIVVAFRTQEEELFVQAEKKK